MLMNEKRAELGRQLAARLISLTGAVEESAVAQAMTNLMHLCQKDPDRFGQFEANLDLARNNFKTELTEQAGDVYPEESTVDQDGVPDFGRVFDAALETVTEAVNREIVSNSETSHEGVLAAIREREEIFVRVDMMKQILLAVEPQAIDEIRATFSKNTIQCHGFLDTTERFYTETAGFDAIEIHGIRCYEPGVEELNDSATDAFGVYVHIESKGIDQIGQFSSPRMAEDYAKYAADRYQVAIYNYSLSNRPAAKAAGPSM